MLSPRLLVLVTLVGCASASHDYGREGQDGGIKVIDSPEGRGDAPETTADAEPHIDASPTCTIQTLDLLANGSLDGAPEGTGWTATPIDPTYPIITTDAGPIAAQSGADRAWMGGFEQTSTDEMYQDVTLPAMTTALVMSGYWALYSDEGTGTAYDKSFIELTDTAGNVIESVLAIDNRMPAAAWTAFSHTFTNVGALGGQVVRIRLRSSNDSSDVSSFFYDTLALNATACQ